MALRYVPPRGSEIECVVEQFLTRHGAKDYVMALHQQLFGDVSPAVYDGSILEMRQFKPPELARTHAPHRTAPHRTSLIACGGVACCVLCAEQRQRRWRCRRGGWTSACATIALP